MCETYPCNDYGIAGRTAALLSCTTQALGMRATGWLSDSRVANGEATGESSNLARFGNAQSMVDTLGQVCPMHINDAFVRS